MYFNVGELKGEKINLTSLLSFHSLPFLKMSVTQSIEHRYVLDGEPDTIFLLVTPPNSTVQTFLDLVHEKHSTSCYQYIWYNNKFLDPNESVNFLHQNKDDFFFLTKEKISPSTQILDNVVKVFNESLADFKVSLPDNSEVNVPSDQNNEINDNINDFNNDSPNEPFNIKDFEIKTEKIKFPKAENGKHRFFCTITPDFMLNGVDVDLNLSYDPKQCKNYLLEFLKSYFNDNTNVHSHVQSNISLNLNNDNYDLLVYLPGGLPFIGGTLNDLFENGKFKVKNVIYGVLIRKIPEETLNKEYFDFWNVSNENRKQLISPLFDSTDRGVIDIACLLGYISFEGLKSRRLIKNLSCLTHFAPLMTSLQRIYDKNHVSGRDIATFCCSLHTYFQYMITGTIPPNKIFEYGIKCCNLIAHIKKIKYVPIQRTNIIQENTSPIMQTFIKLQYSNDIYFVQTDSCEYYSFEKLIKPEPQLIVHSFDFCDDFRPISTYPFPFSRGCQIIKGQNHAFLFIPPVVAKELQLQSKIDIINPLFGAIESKTIQDFITEQGIIKSMSNITQNHYNKNHNFITMIILDESLLMSNDLEGNPIQDESISSRSIIAHQYLLHFVSTYWEDLFNYGWMSFNDKITKNCSICSSFSDFERAINQFHAPEGPSCLWDAISEGADEIITFMANNHVDSKPLLESRILVISQGIDNNSQTKLHDLIQKLLKNHIHVDSLIVNTKSTDEGDLKKIVTLCHATNGVSFRPNTILEGFSLLETQKFINISSRKSPNYFLIPKDRSSSSNYLKKYPEKVTEDFLIKAFDYAEFNSKFQTFTVKRLATPRKPVNSNHHTPIRLGKINRILMELQTIIKIDNPSNKPLNQSDDDIIIHTNMCNLDFWIVFMRGPEKTPYENKWWNIHVTFPKSYPVDPPRFQFITIPFHLNVYSDGSICPYFINQSYHSSKHVIEILREIKELLIHPDASLIVRIQAFDNFRNNPDEYYRLAQESADNNIYDTISKFTEIYQYFDMDNDFPVEIGMNYDFTPVYKPLDRESPDVVKSSTGVFYKREELKQILKCSKNPICVVTGKPLTEKLEDI
ncbi:hypothetical protein TRFO_09408 [Tritrichomonas foetus]|uniref:UBC core domain-containing protein n=1 Tax=Tritrichomonas foetus TaxID=1144522 RepID=A0A1J4JGJ4_9EUKA|nr:hypothetical protein TRFO_09408 [Tritrichomonas foetus]|eukprot:OHS97423.1 hypothetical protein TRFO_09408 [Tritrichomonas foetus]